MGSLKRKSNKRKLRLTEIQNFANLKHKVQAQEKTIFDLRQLLEISRSFNSMIELTRLMESILYIVMTQMKTFGVAVFAKMAFDDESFTLYENAYGFELQQDAIYSIPENHDFTLFLTTQNKCISPEELEHLFGHSNDASIKNILGLNPSLVVPLKVKKRLIGFLLLGSQIEDTHSYDTYEQNMILDIANLAATALNNAQLLEMSTTDMMTHLKLKHYFFAVLGEKLETVDHHSPISLCMFDIDNFKKINDTYGHVCGDLVLQKVATIIKNSIRNTDLAARYGGEEFAALLTDASIETACTIAERIRSQVEAMEVEYEGQIIKVTISIGIAQYTHDRETMKQFINRSDIALYESKHNGKNRYSISSKNIRSNS